MQMNKLREVYLGAQTMSPESTLSLLNPTLLYIWFLFSSSSLWVDGCLELQIHTFPDLPSPRKISLYLTCHLKINYLSRTLHNVLFGQTSIVSISNTWTSDIWYVQKSRFTFNEMNHQTWTATSTGFKLLFPVTTLVTVSKNEWSSSLFALMNFIFNLTLLTLLGSILPNAKV